MAQQFCTQCGTRIENAQQRFCTSCGASLSAAPAPSPSDSAETVPVASYADTSGVDRMANDQIPLGSSEAPPYTSQRPAVGQASVQGTQQMPPARPYSVVPQMPAAPSQPPVPPQGRNSNTSLIVAIIVAVLIVLVAIALVIFHPWDGGSASPSPASSTSVAPSSSQEETVSSSTSSSTAAASSSSSAVSASSSGDASDEQLYDTLVSAYDSMAGFDDRIRNVATDFNDTYTSSDNGLRRTNSTVAHDLKNEISARLDSLSSQNVSSSSRYYQDYQNIVRLMQDLYNRIDVICQSWDNALSYNNPKDHTDAILAPIARDNESDGVNKYKRDFDTLYPNARPTK